MTKKWLCQTPNPPRIPIFYTLKQIHKLSPVGRPIISGCDGPTEKLSSFVDTLLQASSADSNITEVISKKHNRFYQLYGGEKKIPEETILVSMDVTSLYTNIPQEEGINLTICVTYSITSTTIIPPYQDSYRNSTQINTAGKLISI